MNCKNFRNSFRSATLNIELSALYNQTGQHERAAQLVAGRQFNHGKVAKAARLANTFGRNWPWGAQPRRKMIMPVPKTFRTRVDVAAQFKRSETST